MNLSAIIVLDIGMGVNRYLREHGKTPPRLKIPCPTCGYERLLHHGSYEKFHIGNSIRKIPIYRFRCPRCKKTHSLIPAFSTPYSPYAPYVREGLIRKYLWGEPLSSFPSPGNLMRWLKSASLKARSALIALSELVLRLRPGCNPSFRLPPSRRRWRALAEAFAWAKEMPRFIMRMRFGVFSYLGI